MPTEPNDPVDNEDAVAETTKESKPAGSPGSPKAGDGAAKSLAGSRQAQAPSGGSNAMKRYGPIAAIAAVALIVVGFLVLGGGGDDTESPEEVATGSDDDGSDTDGSDTDGGDDDATGDDSSSGDSNDTEDGNTEVGDDGSGGETGDSDDEVAGPEDPLAGSDLPEGVMSLNYARENGIDVDPESFGERCDTETGLVKVPDFFRPGCWLPFDGDNGGATAPGVTEDSIKIVYYQAQDNDPVINYITSAIVNDDDNADAEATVRGLLPYYETYYETYGRSVELEVFVASGLATDAISARADAVEVAEMEPFMVWGGPILTNAFAEELHARGVACIGCGPSQDKAFYDEFAPLSWSISMGSEQAGVHVAEYVSKRLAGEPAVHAGAEFQDTERVFGRLWIESSQASVIANDIFEADLAANGVEITESLRFQLDPASIAEQASSAIARLKAAGVTTVIFAGDPVSPANFTQEATAQGYEPEWFIANGALVDTNVFARTYDQDQWSRAFGIGTTAVKVNREVSSSFRKYEWFTGEEPPAPDTIGVIDPTPSLFYAVITAVGPDLTIENFESGLLNADATRSAITAPSLSWGTRDFWDDERFEPDYRGIDDMTEFWWDVTATGPDELAQVGTGLYRFVDNGARYLPGEWPETTPSVFNTENTLTVLAEVPAEEAAPDFDPIG